MDYNGAQLNIKIGNYFFWSEETDAYGMSVGNSLWKIPLRTHKYTYEVKYNGYQK
jgi:hypothetical protein